MQEFEIMRDFLIRNIFHAERDSPERKLAMMELSQMFFGHTDILQEIESKFIRVLSTYDGIDFHGKYFTRTGFYSTRFCRLYRDKSKSKIDRRAWVIEFDIFAKSPFLKNKYRQVKSLEMGLDLLRKHFHYHEYLLDESKINIGEICKL